MRSTTSSTLRRAAGLVVDGYEIHHGRTQAAKALVGNDGAVSGLAAGTYFHGLLDDAVSGLVEAQLDRTGLLP